MGVHKVRVQQVLPSAGRIVVKPGAQEAARSGQRAPG